LSLASRQTAERPSTIESILGGVVKKPILASMLPTKKRVSVDRHGASTELRRKLGDGVKRAA